MVETAFWLDPIRRIPKTLRDIASTTGLCTITLQFAPFYCMRNTIPSARCMFCVISLGINMNIDMLASEEGTVSKAV